MHRFLHRLIGALALDARTFEEVEADPGAGAQALVVVLLSALGGSLAARGLGAPPSALPTLALVGVMTWAAWAVLTCQIGTWMLPAAQTRTGLDEMLRTIGFAAAPGLFAAIGVVPMLSTAVVTITTVWMTAAMVVAVRQALDFTSTARAIAVCVVSLLLSVLGLMLFGSVFTTVLAGQP